MGRSKIEPLSVTDLVPGDRVYNHGTGQSRKVRRVAPVPGKQAIRVTTTVGTHTFALDALLPVVR